MRGQQSVMRVILTSSGASRGLGQLRIHDFKKKVTDTDHLRHRAEQGKS